MNLRYSLLVVFVFLLICVQAQETVTEHESVIPKVRELVDLKVPKEKFYLFLLVGQSNMAGSTPVEAFDTIPASHIYCLNRDNQWEIAKEPLRLDKQIYGVGPGLAFAKTLQLQIKDTTIRIGLIHCAVGGTSINKWMDGVFDEKTNLYPYDWAISRTREALKSGVLKGIIWHQGESDLENTSGYKAKLKHLVENFRTDLKAPDVPFIAGHLPKFLMDRKNKLGHKYCESAAKEKNKSMDDLKNELDYYDVISANGAATKGDQVHFNTPSQRKQGKRYATAMMKMLDK